LHPARSAVNEGWDDDLPDISSDVMLKSEGAGDDAELRGRLLAAEAELDAALQSLGAKEHEIATLRAELEKAAGEVWGGQDVLVNSLVTSPLARDLSYCAGHVLVCFVSRWTEEESNIYFSNSLYIWHPPIKIHRLRPPTTCERSLARQSGASIWPKRRSRWRLP
jgi:hypothetical protein